MGSTRLSGLPAIPIPLLAWAAGSADLVGDDMPPVAMWEAPKNHLMAARAALGSKDVAAASDSLKLADEAYQDCRKHWTTYKEQLADAGLKGQVGIVVVAVVVAVAVVVVAVATAPGAAAAAAGGGATTGGAAAAPAAAAPAAAAVPAVSPAALSGPGVVPAAFAPRCRRRRRCRLEARLLEVGLPPPWQ